MGGVGGTARPEAIAGAVVRFGIRFGGRAMTRMRRLGSRRIVTVMRFRPGGVGYGMSGTAVMRAFAHGNGLQVLRDHETRDQQKSRRRWESASPI